MAQRSALPSTVVAFVEAQLHARVTEVEPLAAGLGTRRFYRVTTDGEPTRLIARVEAAEDPAIRPPGAAPEPPLEPLRSFLEAAKLPVPASHGSDATLAIDLLEDLGDETLERALRRASPGERRALVAEALAPIPRLQALRNPGGLAAFERRLDAKLLAFKGELFARESLPLALGREPREPERQAVRDAFAWIAAALAEAPLRLAHRDLQSRNVMIRPGQPPGARIAWIDLQGAFLAPPEYDAVCLLRDSYFEHEEDEVAAALAALRPALPDAPDESSFLRRFDLLTLTRKGKDHARLLEAARRGVPDAASHLPVTVRALRRAAARRASEHASLARLAELIERLPEDPQSGAPCAR